MTMTKTTRIWVKRKGNNNPRCRHKGHNYNGPLESDHVWDSRALSRLTVSEGVSKPSLGMSRGTVRPHVLYGRIPRTLS